MNLGLWYCLEVITKTLYIMPMYSSLAENAALPHGAGTDRALKKHDFTLIDTGGTLHGYHSDVTRVIFLRSCVPSIYVDSWRSDRPLRSVTL
jgi:hypothetical protein